MDAEFPKTAALFNYLMNTGDYYCASLEEINNAKQEKANLTRELNTQKELVSHLKQENDGLKKELNETTLRLSTIMGMKITNDNPDIADLSDDYRPTNLSAMFSELYDNEWTDAFVLLTPQMSEREAIKWLLVILIDIKKNCEAQQQAKSDEVRRTLLVNEGDTIPDFVLKYIKENRKKRATSLMDTEYKEYQARLSQSTVEWRNIALHLPAYTQECFRVCYLMSIQDPPVVFDTLDITHGDTKNYKAYTKIGEKVDFVVWPCLRLCNDGGVLSKGVVQFIPLKKSANVRSATVSVGPEIFGFGDGRNTQTKQNEDAEFRNQQGAIENESYSIQVESEMDIGKYDAESNKIADANDESLIEHGPDDNIRTYNQMSRHDGKKEENVELPSSASAESCEKTAHVDGKQIPEIKHETVAAKANHRSFVKQMKHNEDAESLYQKEASEKERDHIQFESKMEFQQSDKETRPSLSEMMGMQITNDNADIADLSDQNRLTNIAEMYSKLYDNQWRDAYEKLKIQMSETEAIKWLLDILEATHQYCVKKQQRWMEELLKTLYVNKDGTVPDFVMRFINENRKTVETENQAFSEMLSNATSEMAKMALSIPDYTKECFKVCYLMSIQDPPMVLDTSLSDMLDTKKYKQYTQKGEKIDFMVWPCLLLCKDGDVLCKGTVQCIPSTKCSVNAKHASLNRGKQSMLKGKQKKTQRKHEQDAARVDQITGGIEGSHVHQTGNDKECDGLAIKHGSDSPRVAKLPAENQPSGYDVNTDIKQDHQSSASKVSLIGTGNQTVSPGNYIVDEVAGATDANAAIINASDIQNVAKTSEENQLNSFDDYGNFMHGDPASISDEANTKRDMDNVIMSGSDDSLDL